MVDDLGHYQPKPNEECNDELNQNLEKLFLEHKEENPSSENIINEENDRQFGLQF